MEDILYYTNLFDYYKDLLTETQRKYFKDYYFDNLSLIEIADNNQISKNAVSKTLIETNNKLDYYEDKLKLYSNYKQIKTILKEDDLEKISSYI